MLSNQLFHTCLVISSVVATTTALTIGSTFSAITNYTRPLAFKPSSCKGASASASSTNDWDSLQLCPTALPDPTSEPNRLNTNDTTLFTIKTKPGNDKATISVGRGVCVQLRHFKFTDEIGWIRTRPFLIDDADSDYYVIYHTNFSAKAKIWRDQGRGTDRWEIFYETPAAGMSYLQYRLKGFEWFNREIMVDLNLQPGVGLGTTGEIALFSTNTFPKSG